MKLLKDALNCVGAVAALIALCGSPVYLFLILQGAWSGALFFYLTTVALLLGCCLVLTLVVWVFDAMHGSQPHYSAHTVNRAVQRGMNDIDSIIDSHIQTARAVRQRLASKYRR